RSAGCSRRGWWWTWCPRRPCTTTRNSCRTCSTGTSRSRAARPTANPRARSGGRHEARGRGRRRSAQWGPVPQDPREARGLPRDRDRGPGRGARAGTRRRRGAGHHGRVAPALAVAGPAGGRRGDLPADPQSRRAPGPDPPRHGARDARRRGAAAGAERRRRLRVQADRGPRTLRVAGARDDGACGMKATPDIRILIVEDDPFFQRVLLKRLAAEGYQVQAAADGREGMKAIVTYEPDLVISDWMMPHWQGLGPCQP